MTQQQLKTLFFGSENGREPYKQWLWGLDTRTRVRVAMEVERCELNPAFLASKTKHLGEGLQEIRMHFGPGYRVYFAISGDRFILLGGSDKSNQQREIDNARQRLAEWRSREKRSRRRDRPRSGGRR